MPRFKNGFDSRGPLHFMKYEITTEYRGVITVWEKRPKDYLRLAVGTKIVSVKKV